MSAMKNKTFLKTLEEAEKRYNELPDYIKRYVAQTMEQVRNEPRI